MKAYDEVRCRFDYLFTDDFMDADGYITKHDVYDAHLKRGNYYIHFFKKKNGVRRWSVFSGGGIEQVSIGVGYNSDLDDLVRIWNESIESGSLDLGGRGCRPKWHVSWYELFDNKEEHNERKMYVYRF